MTFERKRPKERIRRENYPNQLEMVEDGVLDKVIFVLNNYVFEINNEDTRNNVIDDVYNVFNSDNNKNMFKNVKVVCNENNNPQNIVNSGRLVCDVFYDNFTDDTEGARRMHQSFVIKNTDVTYSTRRKK